MYLDEVQAQLFNCYNKLKLENKVLSPQNIKARFLGEDKIEYSLIYLIAFFNEKMSNKLKPKTISHYKTSQKYIMNYVTKEYRSDNRFLLYLRLIV